MGGRSGKDEDRATSRSSAPAEGFEPVTSELPTRSATPPPRRRFSEAGAQRQDQGPKEQKGDQGTSRETEQKEAEGEHTKTGVGDQARDARPRGTISAILRGTDYGLMSTKRDAVGQGGFYPRKVRKERARRDAQGRRRQACSFKVARGRVQAHGRGPARRRSKDAGHQGRTEGLPGRRRGSGPQQIDPELGKNHQSRAAPRPTIAASARRQDKVQSRGTTQSSTRSGVREGR